ncbi:MAG: Hsp70 family protein [Myxococcota bacterium]
MRPRPALGIDFGTSNTCASWVDGRAHLHSVPVSDVDALLPSLVWVGPQGRVRVGADARSCLMQDPANTLFGMKRLLGRSFRSSYVARLKDRLPFKLIPDATGRCAVEVRGQPLSLEEAASHVIRHLAQLARAHAGEPFESCVITVPAHFGYRQRQSVREAATLAGLEVRALINEPTAAALAQVRGWPTHDPILVFDIGGGTFDVTVINVVGHLVKVLANGGDAFLGGADLDERLALLLAQRFEAEHGVDIKGNRITMRRLIYMAEMAKIVLSSELSTTVRLPLMPVGNRMLDLECEVTREMLEGAVAPLVERMVGACEELLRRVGLTPGNVGQVVLVGGPTRMPMLQERLRTVFNRAPRTDVHPELVVSEGAALLAHGLTRPAGPGLVDAVSVPIWVMAPGGPPRQVIRANAPLPCVSRFSVDVAALGEGPALLMFYESVHATSTERDILGSVRLHRDRIPPGVRSVEMEVRMTEDFRLELDIIAPDATRRPLDMSRPIFAAS